MPASDPHHNAELLRSGPNLRDASSAMILLHGRGGSAQNLLSFGQQLASPSTALIAPQAADHTWYPDSFLAPIARNEPWLSSAIRLIETLAEQCLSQNIASARIVLCGFSQGACLSTEFAARHPRRYLAVLAFTGGLIGPPGSDLHHPGSLAGTPVLLSSGDPDPHVPWARVEETAVELRRMHADVEVHRYSGRPHTIIPAEVTIAKELLQRVMQSNANPRDKVS
jgi:phospholipase/carboxylesterase